MKILLDENIPQPMRRFFADVEVQTVQSMGWAGVKNGELIAKADQEFDVLILADKNLRYQQDLRGRRIALVELPTNRWPLLQGLRDAINEAVLNAQPGSYTIVRPS